MLANQNKVCLAFALIVFTLSVAVSYSSSPEKDNVTNVLCTPVPNNLHSVDANIKSTPVEMTTKGLNITSFKNNNKTTSKKDTAKLNLLSVNKPNQTIEKNNSYEALNKTSYVYITAGLDGNDVEASGEEFVTQEASGQEFAAVVPEEFGNVRADIIENPASNCSALAPCFNADDCGSEKSLCLGFFVGTCDCNACLSGLPCTSDSQCGGLKNACGKSGLCNCIQGLISKGFSSYANAVLEFCNKKTCVNDPDACFGLPCKAGRCFCN